MNFFGHACLAARRDETAGFVLGSMLPDLMAMLGGRRVASGRERTAAGIRFHHATDEVFHATEMFKELSHTSSSWLLTRGLGRGPARAVGHVGIEMLLDSCLSEGESFPPCIAQALVLGCDVGEIASLTVSPASSAPNLAGLCQALRQGAKRFADHRPEVVATRLVRALSGHPRLALATTDVALTTEWAAHFLPSVQSVAVPWVQEIERRLGGGLGGEIQS